MSRSFLAGCVLLAMVGIAGCGVQAQGQSVAASVNGHDISMATYDKEVHYRRVVSQEGTGVDVCLSKATAGLCSQLKQNVLTTLIDEELVHQYASAHHIAVSQADFDREWAIVDRTNFQNRKDVLNAYAKRYGLTPQDVKNQTREDVLQNRVMYAVTRTMPNTTKATRLARIDVSTLALAQSVKRQLQSGTPFTTVVARLSTNKKALCHQHGCGELGWLPNSFIPSGDQEVFTAPIGSAVGPYIGHSQYGNIYYEVLVIDGRKSSYAMTPAQQLRMRQNLFLAWLAKQRKQAQIKRYV